MLARLLAIGRRVALFRIMAKPRASPVTLTMTGQRIEVTRRISNGKVTGAFALHDHRQPRARAAIRGTARIACYRCMGALKALEGQLRHFSLDDLPCRAAAAKKDHEHRDGDDRA